MENLTKLEKQLIELVKDFSQDIKVICPFIEGEEANKLIINMLLRAENAIERADITVLQRDRQPELCKSDLNILLSEAV